MKLTNTAGVGTLGLTGIMIAAAVMWSQIPVYWLGLAVPLILAGIGSEAPR